MAGLGHAYWMAALLIPCNTSATLLAPANWTIPAQTLVGMVAGTGGDFLWGLTVQWYVGFILFIKAVLVWLRHLHVSLSTTFGLIGTV